jgi:dTDP-4-dehydrorhamnose 3,5-epimerase
MIDVTTTPLAGVLLLRPKVFTDERGSFTETWNARTFREATGVDARFFQDNESTSHKGVLRGLHYQLPPFAQAKLVRVPRGAVLDVVVDLRPGSPTMGMHFKTLLEAGGAQLWIPEGFAHGFVALEENTVFAYKCTAPYHKESERTIAWNDPRLAIDWGTTDPLVGEKDRHGMAFREDLWPA